MSSLSNQSGGRLIRHSGITRVNHWLMALCMLALLVTAFFPILGIKFAWVTIHWVAGIIFTLSVLFHIVYALAQQDWRAMWIAFAELADLISSLAGDLKALKVSPGKYWLMQKIFHHIVAFLSFVAIVTGVLMLFKIDSPLWERDPYVLSSEVWGIVYVLHDFAGLCFIPLIMMHVYFAVRPEKLFYTRSMMKGWITEEEYRAHHDPQKWVVKSDTEEGG